MKTITPRIKKLTIYFITAIFSSATICFSYLFGSTRSEDLTYAVLMSLDSKVKEQTETDFLHGSLYASEGSKTREEEYNYYLSLQRKTKGNPHLYNSLLASSNDSGFQEYQVDFQLSGLSDLSTNLVQVSSYYDYEFMESLGLPLACVSEQATRINPKNGATYGSYISATYAELIVANNGMLTACNNDLQAAFFALVSSESFIYRAYNDETLGEQGGTFSVNNIFVDPDHSDLLSDYQKQVMKPWYGEYFSSFTHWFQNPIFTFSPMVFSKGSTYVFDVRRNFGNLDLFMGGVIGYDYAKKDLGISFFGEKGNLLEESEALNQFSAQYGKSPKYFYLALSLLFTAATLVFVLRMGDKTFSRRGNALLSLIPFFLFALAQVVFSLLLLFGFDKVALYSLFNPTGNIVLLIACLIVPLVVAALKVGFRK